MAGILEILDLGIGTVVTALQYVGMECLHTKVLRSEGRTGSR